MKRIAVLVGLLFFVFSLASCARAKNEPAQQNPPAAKSESEKEGTMPSDTPAKGPMFVEGEILVKFKPEVKVDDIARIIKEEYNCEILDIIEGLDVYRLKIPRGKTVTEMVELLNKDARVKYSEPNIIYKLQL